MWLLDVYFVNICEKGSFFVVLVAISEWDVTQKQVHVNGGDPAIIVKIKPKNRKISLTW